MTEREQEILNPIPLSNIHQRITKKIARPMDHILENLAHLAATESPTVKQTNKDTLTEPLVAKDVIGSRREFFNDPLYRTLHNRYESFYDVGAHESTLEQRYAALQELRERRRFLLEQLESTSK